MRLRPVIRILLLLPFLFFTAWWITSHFRVTGIAGGFWFLYGEYNSINLLSYGDFGTFSDIQIFQADLADFGAIAPIYSLEFLGFGQGFFPLSVNNSCTRIPFWFPTALTAILIFVARRLQRTPKPGKAFPMDSHPPTS